MAFVVGDQLTRYVSKYPGLRRKIRALLEANTFVQLINLIGF